MRLLRKISVFESWVIPTGEEVAGWHSVSAEGGAAYATPAPGTQPHSVYLLFLPS